MQEIIKVLKNDGIAIIPTDTIYGIVGCALNKVAVGKIYALKERTPSKPFIILISDINDLKTFNIKISTGTKKLLEKYWPGPVSVILECLDSSFEYLHRGTESLAFRLPANKDLVDLIRQTGPLVAPSANPEGLPPANNVSEAKEYFGEKIDFYVQGKTSAKPSKIVRITDEGEEVIRP